MTARQDDDSGGRCKDESAYLYVCAVWERTVIDVMREEPIMVIGTLASSKQGGPLSYHSRSASPIFVAIIQASADS